MGLIVWASVCTLLALVFGFLSVACFVTGGPVGAGIQIAAAALVMGTCAVYSWREAG